MGFLPHAFVVLCFALFTTFAGANTNQPPDAPIDVTPLIKGRVITVDHPLHGIVNYDYRANGQIFASHSAGSDSGKWEIKGNVLCVKMRRWNDACGTIMVIEGKVVYRKTDGNELVFYAKDLTGCDAAEARRGGVCSDINIAEPIKDLIKKLGEASQKVALN